VRKIWDEKAWEDYLYWQFHDKQMLKRVNMLIRDVERSPFDGIGKPDPLKNGLTGLWSRRINDIDRLTYKVIGDVIVILACKGQL